jgi:DNA-binding protein YbaB
MAQAQKMQKDIMAKKEEINQKEFVEKMIGRINSIR